MIELDKIINDIYDILTHLTFLFIESTKICEKVFFEETQTTIRDGDKLEAYMEKVEPTDAERAVASELRAILVVGGGDVMENKGGGTIVECRASNKSVLIELLE